MIHFGEFFKARRMALGKTLRQFCVENSLDPGNISKLERGLLPPPQHEKLEAYAVILGIPRGSDEWYQFFDLAAAEAGRIPDDILSDERVAGKLPVLFRTVRGGGKLSDQQFEELVRKVREAYR
ncbi:MAG: helix-turn-helix domain-containing protein [Planctomycetota bacterium]